MNIQQFQYVLAVVDSKNFEDAAEKCFVTQSTLSTMINKFEKEIGIRIFNRKTKPVSITKEGEIIVTRLRVILNEIGLLENVFQELKGEMIGDLKIGVIPTIAPYLLPLFIHEFSERFPYVEIHVKELTTHQIQTKLLNRELDIGILALPLNNKELTEIPLYEEPFLLYDCSGEMEMGPVLPKDLNFSKMCLLEEGHCLRTQIYELCELKEKYGVSTSNLKFESGSMESLIRITESRKGITVLPYLAYKDLSEAAQQNIRQFAAPIPVRSIGLITHKFFAKKGLKTALIETIQSAVSPLIPEEEGANVIEPLGELQKKF